MKASAIVVSYNRASTLAHCIEKLHAQSADDYEVIVIDDGSTDSTQNIMEKIKDNRFRYFRNKGKKGQPYARNKGIKKCSIELFFRLLNAPADWDHRQSLAAAPNEGRHNPSPPQNRGHANSAQELPKIRQMKLPVGLIF